MKRWHPEPNRWFAHNLEKLQLLVLHVELLKNVNVVYVLPQIRHYVTFIMTLIVFIDQVGGTVGYQVRFDRQYSGQTILTYMTEGILLRVLMGGDSHPFKFVIIDEAHERSFNTDLLMGVLKKKIMSGEDLKLIVMSATLNPEKFGCYFDDAPFIQVLFSLRINPINFSFRRHSINMSYDRFLEQHIHLHIIG